MTKTCLATQFVGEPPRERTATKLTGSPKNKTQSEICDSFIPTIHSLCEINETSEILTSVLYTQATEYLCTDVAVWTLEPVYNNGYDKIEASDESHHIITAVKTRQGSLG